MVNFKSPSDVAGRAPRFLSTFGDSPVWAAIAISSIGANIAVAADNSGIFMGFRPKWDLVVSSIVWVVGSHTSGHYDIGLLDDAGVRLWSKGATTTPAVGATVSDAVTGVTLRGGNDYYVGWSTDVTSTEGVRGISGTNVGELSKLLDGTPSVFSVPTVYPLPSTVTLGSTAPNRLPLFIIRGT